jgi:hypothetical protein
LVFTTLGFATTIPHHGPAMGNPAPTKKSLSFNCGSWARALPIRFLHGGHGNLIAQFNRLL